jgi:hypothetical protein
MAEGIGAAAPGSKAGSQPFDDTTMVAIKSVG